MRKGVWGVGMQAPVCLPPPPLPWCPLASVCPRGWPPVVQGGQGLRHPVPLHAGGRTKVRPPFPSSLPPLTCIGQRGPLTLTPVYAQRGRGCMAQPPSPFSTLPHPCVRANRATPLGLPAQPVQDATGRGVCMGGTVCEGRTQRWGGTQWEREREGGHHLEVVSPLPFSLGNVHLRGARPNPPPSLPACNVHTARNPTWVLRLMRWLSASCDDVMSDVTR
jgi:hypothetical protein